MATVTLTKENIESLVSNSGILLVDCWAGWCGACKMVAPAYTKVSERHPEYVFGKLDTQTESDLTSSLGIEHIPSLLVFRDGVLLFNKPGNFDEEAIEDIIAQAASLDMDAVHAEISASEAAEGQTNERVVRKETL